MRGRDGEMVGLFEHKNETFFKRGSSDLLVRTHNKFDPSDPIASSRPQGLLHVAELEQNYGAHMMWPPCFFTR